MTYGITGIKAGLGPGEQVPLRREIDEWWFSKDANDLNQRSLFIYALIEFMDMTPEPEDSNDLSYFSIAGIHGQPLRPWDTDEAKNGDYCPHGQATFPSWHRPYVLLYEQRLYEIMRHLIPTTFDQKDHDAMFRAAETWRLPYWDWAMKKPDWDQANPDSPKNLGPKVGPNVPFVITQKYVEVKTKTGTNSVPNPMLKYTLPGFKDHLDDKTFGDYGIIDGNEKPYPDCKATSRHPKTYDAKEISDYKEFWVNGEDPEVENWKTIRGELRGAPNVMSNTLPEAVYRLFSFRPSFEQFGTEKWTDGQRPKFYSSLESVHGWVHGFVGGDGQMGTISVAAFDPIFWMHHCNIDRLFAMWQELYDDEYKRWLEKSKLSEKWLAPFHLDSENTPHTPRTCSLPQENLGYTYPELQSWLDKYRTNGSFDRQKYKTDIRTAIELKYSTTGKSALQLPKNERIATTHMSAMKTENLAIEHFPPALLQKAEQTALTKPPVLITPLASWQENDFVVNVVYDRFALNGNPYIIRIFLGDVPEGPPFYFEDCPTEVAFIYNFSSPVNGRGTGPDGCENCRTQRKEGALSSGQIILTDYLVENLTKEVEQRGLTLTSLSRDEVTTYLKKNLHWRISDHNDRTVPKEDMPSLKISVATAKITHYAEASRFSEYGDYDVLWSVTEGRLAGANPGDLGLPVP